MNMQTLEDTGLLYFVTKMKLFILIVLVLKMFLKKFKNLLDIKTSKPMFFEHKQSIQKCVVTFCIGLIDFMLAGKKLTDFTNLFSPHDFQKIDYIIFSYFKGG